ncbi:MAG: flagellar hook basal-body protein [Melioribacteraceae bacterium]
MIKGIYTAGRSLDHRMKNIDVIANNLANLGTTGYKREVPFTEILNQYGDVSVRKVTSQVQGDVLQTSNPLDLAISGNGFFTVKGEDGQLELTRDGRFKLSDEGFLINSNGQKVIGQNGEISIDESLLEKDPTINITKTGEIKIGERTIDSLLIVNVENSEDLIRGGGSNFLLNDTEYKSAEEGSFQVSQGFLEESNTNPILEMESMISINKEYETAQKVIAALDTSLGQANEIGKV